MLSGQTETATWFFCADCHERYWHNYTEKTCHDAGAHQESDGLQLGGLNVFATI
ncbi:hypothetical protein [Rhodopirellula sp. MGV]|uniref:hypothetical protein n=1 Tax=Rhodopirellula sp. MGV TaxID=2023130 RepID=UPI0013040C65|nr:hypothetical protein [Rhodopirellula sp. MGV]